MRNHQPKTINQQLEATVAATIHDGERLCAESEAVFIRIAPPSGHELPPDAEAHN